MTKPLNFSILSFNMHKGKTISGRCSIKRIKETLHNEKADILFLQEVIGERIKRFSGNSLVTPQHQYIAEEGWNHNIYYENLVHSRGHHGNALLSQFPIINHSNLNVSAYTFEKRGILTAIIKLPNEKYLYCFCLHFAIIRQGRLKQLKQLISLINRVVPENSPLVIAGDFNDWQEQGTPILQQELGLQEAFKILYGKHAITFPSYLPLLALDRIYFRNLKVEFATILTIPGSDHRALKASFSCLLKFD
jgi:endonuclease/exonuclease/phosphatase family metal-dependent hydrolase